MAREWLEKGVDAAEGLDKTTSPVVFAADPGVITRGLLAPGATALGLVDQAGRAWPRRTRVPARCVPPDPK